MIAQKELFEPFEYLDYTGAGFFSILEKPNGDPRQHSYPLNRLPEIIKGANPDRDTWISQASFVRPNRRAVSMKSIGLIFADLDTYKVEGLAGKTADQLTDLFLLFCIVEGIPTPSLVLFSGRGLQVKWIFEEALGNVDVTSWARVEACLIRSLADFAVDTVCRDVSRVLRLDGTRNTKSGELVRVTYDSQVKYYFEDLAHTFLKIAPEPVLKLVTPRKTAPNPNRIIYPAQWETSRLNWARMQDIRKLWELRGGVQEGYREITLFWELNFLCLSRAIGDGQFWHEARSIAHEISPDGDFFKETDLTTIYRKSREMNAGSRIEFQGKTYSPLYTPKNSTLAEVFGITSDEETYLNTIISKAEVYRRNNERREALRRESGKPTRNMEVGKPWEAEGISRRTWYRRQESKTR